MDPYDGRVVISFIRQALNNEPLTVFGEGKQTRSLCYVSDLVRGINLTMESDFHEPINLGNPDELTILQIAKEILALIPGSKSKIVFQPMPPDDPRVRCPDITRAKQDPRLDAGRQPAGGAGEDDRVLSRYAAAEDGVDSRSKKRTSPSCHPDGARATEGAGVWPPLPTYSAGEGCGEGGRSSV